MSETQTQEVTTKQSYEIKRKSEGAKRVTIRLEKKHLDKGEQLRAKHGLKDLSSVVRYLIEKAEL